MSSFYIELTDKEIVHICLATAKAIKGNGNKDAVNTFETVLKKLEPYIDDATKMSVQLMKVIF